MDDIVKWLESPEGRAWSRSVHKQSTYQTAWFSIKEDYIEIAYKYETQIQRYGRYDTLGRFRAPVTREVNVRESRGGELLGS